MYDAGLFEAQHRLPFRHQLTENAGVGGRPAPPCGVLLTLCTNVVPCVLWGRGSLTRPHGPPSSPFFLLTRMPPPSAPPQWPSSFSTRRAPGRARPPRLRWPPCEGSLRRAATTWWSCSAPRGGGAGTPRSAPRREATREERLA